MTSFAVLMAFAHRSQFSERDPPQLSYTLLVGHIDDVHTTEISVRGRIVE